MCGFCQSVLATVPVMVTGLSPSYSAAKEWWADTAAVPTRRLNAMTQTHFIDVVLFGVMLRHCNRGSMRDGHPPLEWHRHGEITDRCIAGLIGELARDGEA